MEDSDREKPWRNSEWDNVKKATKKDFPRSFEIISEIDDWVQVCFETENIRALTEKTRILHWRKNHSFSDKRIAAAVQKRTGRKHPAHREAIGMAGCRYCSAGGRKTYWEIWVYAP